MPEPKTTHDAAKLQAGYAKWHRATEFGGMLVTTGIGIWLIVRIAQAQPTSGWWMPLEALIGLLFADFMSGFVHWAFDTWGRVDTPIFGSLAIRVFRHHHADEKAITHHDFVETNGHNFGLSLLLVGIGILVVNPKTATLIDVFIGMCLLFGAVFTCMTSQIHKWAHMDRPPRVVQLLQRARLVLSPDHHSDHHAAPYNRNYCITIGWMNGPLRAARFFETLERIITAVTGAIPREDDIGKEAALEVAAAEAAAPLVPDPEPETEEVLARVRRD